MVCMGTPHVSLVAFVSQALTIAIADDCSPMERWNVGPECYPSFWGREGYNRPQSSQNRSHAQELTACGRAVLAAELFEEHVEVRCGYERLKDR